MSAPTYSLVVDSEERTFAELQITGAMLTTKVGDNDTLELTQKADSIPDAIVEFLPNGGRCALLENGQQIFVGRITPSTRAASGGIRQPYRVVGGWAELTGRYYAQPWASGPSTNVIYGRVALGYDGQTRANVTSGLQIQRAVEWAILKGAPLAVGVVDAGIRILPEYVENRSCAEVIGRMLQYTPHHIPFFDYTTTPHPTFHCRQATASVGPGAIVGGGITPHAADGGLMTVTVAKEMFSGVMELRRSFENKINGVVMVVKTQAMSEESLTYITSWLEVKVPEDAELGRDGVIPFSFDGQDFEGVEGPGIGPLLQTQAETFLEATAQMDWAGTGTLKGLQAPAIPGVGYRLNIAGGDEEWATMNAVVQSSRRDLLNGTNTITWGPPRGLTLGQLMSIALGRRHRVAFHESLQEEQATGESEEQNGGWDGSMGKKKSAEGEANEAAGLVLPPLPFDSEVKILGATNAGYSLYETTDECPTS